jgi:hypothetical protein
MYSQLNFMSIMAAKKNKCMYEIIMDMLKDNPYERISSAGVVTQITNQTPESPTGYCSFI